MSAEEQKSTVWHTRVSVPIYKIYEGFIIYCKPLVASSSTRFKGKFVEVTVTLAQKT